VTNFGFSFDSAKLARSKNVAWIWERRGDADCAGLAIQLPVYKNYVALLRVDFAIR